MLVGEPVNALQFHEDPFPYHQIGYVFSDVMPFVTNWKRNLRLGAHTAGGQLADQSPFIDLLQESSAQNIGDLERRPNDGLCQIRFVCIRVHPWLLNRFSKQAKNLTN